MNGTSGSEKWADSKAKEMLVAEILSGMITKESDYNEVYNSCDEYQKFPKSNFRSNLKNLIAALEKKENRALSDKQAVQNDLLLHPRPEFTTQGNPFWDTSEAYKLLKQDIDNGVHKTMSPTELWNTRDEYQMFPRDVFRKHIHQETSKRKQKSYWLKKQQLKHGNKSINM